MSDNEQIENNDSDEDGYTDAIAAVSLIVIAVGTVVYWLSGM
jgi:hypothetical protein